MEIALLYTVEHVVHVPPHMAAPLLQKAVLIPRQHQREPDKAIAGNYQMEKPFVIRRCQQTAVKMPPKHIQVPRRLIHIQAVHIPPQFVQFPLAAVAGAEGQHIGGQCLQHMAHADIGLPPFQQERADSFLRQFVAQHDCPLFLNGAHIAVPLQQIESRPHRVDRYPVFLRDIRNRRQYRPLHQVAAANPVQIHMI